MVADIRSLTQVCMRMRPVGCTKTLKGGVSGLSICAASAAIRPQNFNKLLGMIIPYVGTIMGVALRARKSGTNWGSAGGTSGEDLDIIIGTVPNRLTPFEVQTLGVINNISIAVYPSLV